MVGLATMTRLTERVLGGRFWGPPKGQGGGRSMGV